MSGMTSFLLIGIMVFGVFMYKYVVHESRQNRNKQKKRVPISSASASPPFRKSDFEDNLYIFGRGGKNESINITTLESRPAKWSESIIRALEWKRFEDICAAYYREKGFKAEVTKLGADGGIDVKLFRASYSEDKPFGIVQCKSWNTYKVGVKELRELYGIMAAEGVQFGVYATYGDFTADAVAFADGKRIKLITAPILLSMIGELSADVQNRLLAIATEGDYTTPTCPSCGDKMVTRVTRKGPRKGKKFWGCTNYPRCKNTLKISQRT